MNLRGYKSSTHFFPKEPWLYPELKNNLDTSWRHEDLIWQHKYKFPSEFSGKIPSEGKYNDKYEDMNSNYMNRITKD